VCQQVLINVGMTESELDGVFDAADLDGSGFIDYSGKWYKLLIVRRPT
jgi:hypothetical protein